MRATPRLLAMLLLAAGPSLAASGDARASSEESSDSKDPRRQPATSWDVRLAPADEPGEPFEMTGVVRDRGGPPLRRAKVYVYHADASGAYGRSNGPPRLASTLLTDDRGRYRVRSVFPGSYGGFAAHVHFEILEPALGAGFLNVEPAGSRRSRFGGNYVVERGADGVWRLTVDLKPGMMTPSSNVLKPGEALPRVVRPVRDADAWAPPRRDTLADRRRR